MRNYIFLSLTGESREKAADPLRPETWAFDEKNINRVFLDCTEMFLITPPSPLLPHPRPLSGSERGDKGEEVQGVRRESVNLQKLLNCIADRYKEKLTFDLALSIMGMSKSRFCLFFRNQTGMSYIAYINKERIKNAVPLLLETDLPVEAVGYDCGFDSPPSFYKCFKEHCGMSPAKFRAGQRRVEC